MKQTLFYILILILLAGIQSCDNKVEELPFKVALSKGYPENSYANYYEYVRSFDSTITCLDMYNMPIDSALELLRECSGLILTGGTDINPDLYGDVDDTNRCMTIDDHRDSLELRLIDSAMAWNMPILGICRGHQMLNVAFGGSLIIDIPTDFDTTVHHRCEDFLTCFHPLNVDEECLLSKITGLTSGTVNSNHHQGIKTLAPALRISSRSPDNLPESVEWAEPEGKPFMIGVQWHPERLDPTNPLTHAIGEKFLEECRKYK